MDWQDSVSGESLDYESHLVYKLVKQLYMLREENRPGIAARLGEAFGPMTTALAVADPIKMLETVQYLYNLPVKSVLFKEEFQHQITISEFNSAVFKETQMWARKRGAQIVYKDANSGYGADIYSKMQRVVRDSQEQFFKRKQSLIQSLVKQSFILADKSTQPDMYVAVEAIAAMGYIKVLDDMKQSIQYNFPSDATLFCIQGIANKYSKKLEAKYIQGQDCDGETFAKIVEGFNEDLEELKGNLTDREITLNRMIGSVDSLLKRNRSDHFADDYEYRQISSEPDTILDELCSTLGDVRLVDIDYIPFHLQPELIPILQKLEKMGKDKPKTLTRLYNTIKPHMKFLFITDLKSLFQDGNSDRPQHYRRQVHNTKKNLTVGYGSRSIQMTLSSKELFQKNHPKSASKANKQNSTKSLGKRKQNDSDQRKRFPKSTDTSLVEKFKETFSCTVKKERKKPSLPLILPPASTKLQMLNDLKEWYTSLSVAKSSEASDLSDDTPYKSAKELFKDLISCCMIPVKIPYETLLEILQQQKIISIMTNGSLAYHMTSDIVDELCIQGQARKEDIEAECTGSLPESCEQLPVETNYYRGNRRAYKRSKMNF